MSDVPGESDPSGTIPSTTRRAWHLAGRIVASRPWLDVSWVEGYADSGHLVVHDGVYGPVLHFDDDDGPTWEPRSNPEVELGWEDLEDVDRTSPVGPVDWVEFWGAPAESSDITAKAAIYTLIAHVLDGDGDGRQWAARPAKLVHDTDDSADAPGSAFTLTADFNSLATAIEWYLAQIGSPSWGQGTVWHEPLWLVTRDDEPRLVFDEAGHVHLTAHSLWEVLGVVAARADLGFPEDPDGFDVLEALLRVDGGFAELSTVLRKGQAATLYAVKPDLDATPDPAGGVDPEPAPQPVEAESENRPTRHMRKLHRGPATWESKVRGLMIGLALGDAKLGESDEATSASPLPAGAATQLAAWTAEGLLRRATRYGSLDITGSNVQAVDSLTYAYQRWARLRGLRGSPGAYEDRSPGWMQDVPAMSESRGHSSSMEQVMGTGQASLRDTCRPMIRALPIAVYAGAERFMHCDAREAGKFARRVTEITHVNPVVGDASELAVRIAVHCLRGAEAFTTVFEAAVREVPVPPSLTKAVAAARTAAERPADLGVLRQLAPDDTSKSVLVGALYVSLVFPDWQSAAGAVVFARQAPDGDGVAALVGAFLGALHGYEVFPTADVARLELGWVMDRLALDLALEVKEGQVPLGGWKEGGEPWPEPWWDAKYPGSS